VEYNVVFDVTQSGPRYLWFPAIGLIMVVVGIPLFRQRKTVTGSTRIIAHVMLPFALFWTAGTFIAVVAQYLSLASALRTGRCEVVEGVVTAFHPMPAAGHENEWFVVGGCRFDYSDYRLTAGFNNTSSHGGPLRQGLRVRIHHRNGAIARLEIAKGPP
jgi:hypothetical protein